MSDKVTRNIETNELHNQTIVKEVQHLLREKKTSQEILNYARNKYSDDAMVDSIMEYFTDIRNKYTKVANIFIEAFERKYKNNFYSMSLSKFMKRALKYKKRYDLSDDEFDEIKRIFENKIFNSNNYINNVDNTIYPNTNVSRVLGFPVVETTDSIKPSNSDDYAYLQDLIRMYNMYKNIHSYIVIQTMTYTDLSPEVLMGTFDNNKHNINSFVHPVLAALFLPKIHLIEERMLYANIAGIINTRYNKQRIITKPDYELFYSMIVDPSDIVCDSSSPLRDIKNRAEVQFQLWNNVYNLRNGKFYEATVIDFIATIDKCKISNVDNPDILYLSDEGVILRRLFSVFSFRPIIVQTLPMLTSILNNPLNIPNSPMVITSIPYITYKLPHIALEGQTYSLSDSNKQMQFFMENGTFVPKMTQIIDARGPLIFYVPRRFSALPVRLANPQLQPFGFAEFSSSTRHYENINNIPVEYDDVLEINKSNGPENYYLRSTVVLEKYGNTNIILGHMAYLFQYLRDLDHKIINSTPIEISIYVPRRAIHPANNKLAIVLDDQKEAKKCIQQCGTIFVYATI